MCGFLRLMTLILCMSYNSNILAQLMVYFCSKTHGLNPNMHFEIISLQNAGYLSTQHIQFWYDQQDRSNHSTEIHVHVYLI